MNSHQRRKARRLEERAFFDTNAPRDPAAHQSGNYTNADGDVFHAHGRNMSPETIRALGELTAHVRRMLDAGWDILADDE